MSDLAKEWRLRALTDLWTGDANRNGGRTIPTGLLGSIRWWFEVLVRGLGGAACDPSDADNRCPDQQGKRCVVCELFGCTGWARKFRFEVRDGSGAAMSGQIKKGTEFILRFTPLRPITTEEWALLDLTLRLIAEYGAIGGKTVYKPSDELALADASLSDFDNDLRLQRQVPRSPLKRNDKIIRIDRRDIRTRGDLGTALQGYPTGQRVVVQVQRNAKQETIEAWAGKRHHQDYGFVQVEQCPEIAALTTEVLQAHVQSGRWRKVADNDFAWASLKNFWCVNGRHLARQSADRSTFNEFLGRKQDKSVKEKKGNWVVRWSDLLEVSNDPVSQWLAGRQQESKKVFSFKEPARTFGFQRPGTVSFDTIKDRLRTAWSGFNDNEFLTRDAILARLTAHAGATA